MTEVSSETDGGTTSLIDQIRAKIESEVAAMSPEEIKAQYAALQEKKAKMKAQSSRPEVKARNKAREKEKRARTKAILSRAKELGITGAPTE